MNLFEKVMIRLIQLLSSLFISIFLVIISIWNPVTVNSQAELKHVELGLPLSFLEQDLSRLNISLPAKLGVHSPLEYPFEIFWPSLALSILLVSLIVFISPFLVKKLYSYVLPKKQEKSLNTQETTSHKDIKDQNEKIRQTGL